MLSKGLFAAPPPRAFLAWGAAHPPPAFALTKKLKTPQLPARSVVFLTPRAALPLPRLYSCPRAAEANVTLGARNDHSPGAPSIAGKTSTASGRGPVRRPASTQRLVSGGALRAKSGSRLLGLQGSGAL